MALTIEQQRALDELFDRRDGNPPGTPDLLETWLGVSGDQVKAKLLSMLQAKNTLEHHSLDIVERYPMDAALGFLASASAAFYAAEKGANPKITSYIDAFYYIATCASVGYADIFAATQTGRAIAALVMIAGPALTSRALDRPTRVER
jgi:hypothetical protein